MFAVKRTPRWPDPRVKPPYGAAEIDWAHPLAQNLLACWLMNEGAGDTVVNATGGLFGQLVSAAVSAWSPIAHGLGLVFDGATQYGAVTNGSSILAGLSAFSVTVRARSDVAHPSGTDDYLLSVESGGGQNNKIFVLFKSNAADKYTFRVYNVLTSADAVENAADSGGILRQITGRWDGTTIDLLMDGVLQTNTAVLVGPTNTGVVPLVIGAVDGGAVLWQGAIDFVYLHGIALPTDLALWLAAEPYAFLRPILRRRYFVPAVGGGGPSMVFQSGVMTPVTPGYL